MESIIETFHLDWKLFVAQMVNFAIVVLVLWKFAFKPLSKKLDERTKMIEANFAKTKDIETQQKELAALKGSILHEAKTEAKKTAEEASKQAKQYEEAMRDKTHKEIAKILVQTKETIAQEKNKMLAEVKKEASDLVVLALEKVLQEKITPDLDKKLAAKAISNIVN